MGGDREGPVKSYQTELIPISESIDNGGRRLGGDRRVYSYTGYLPERRVSGDRRSGQDRRQTLRNISPTRLETV